MSRVLWPGSTCSEGHGPEKAPAKDENLPQCGGRLGDTRATPLKRNFSVCVGNSVSSFQHLGRLSGQQLRGRPLSTRGIDLPKEPLACQMLSKFVMVSIPATMVVSKPLPGIVKVMPE